jgi:chromosomal replication initiator protein
MAAWGEFVRLPENAAAVRAVRRLARAFARPGQPLGPVPLLLHGPAGVGKSLLCRTLVDELARNPHGPSVRLLPAGDLLRGGDDDPDPVADLGDCDLLVIEDVQHLPVRSAGLLGRLLDDRGSRRRATLLTAGAGPALLPALPRRLTGRLAAGLVVGVRAFTPGGRRTLAEVLAARRGVRLTDDALDELAGLPTGGGGRPLLGAIEALRPLAREVLGALDADAVRGVLGEADRPVERVVARVAAAFGVPPAEVLGPSRQRRVLVPRQVAMLLAREAGLSLPQVGAAFGRDHTTVLHACRKVMTDLAADPRLRQTVGELRAELG